MQLTCAAALALVSSAVAQIAGFDTLSHPTPNEVLEAGTTYTVKWEAAPSKYDEEKVSLYLMFGPDAAHLSVDKKNPIAAGVTNKLATASWSIDASLGKDKAYGIQIELDSDATVFQWSNPFTIKGSASGGNSTSSSASSSGSAQPTHSGNGTSSSIPKVTTTATGGSSPTNSGTGNRVSTTSTSPGAGAQATAGAFALLGGLAMAALAL